MKRMRFTSLVVLALLLAGSALAASKNLNGCDTLDEPGTYYLKRDVIGARDTCFLIQSDGVTLDLGLHLVEGTAAGNGIDAGDFEDVTIVNGTIERFHNGILSSGARTRVENVSSSSNVNNGIRTGPQAVIRKCVANDNGNLGIFAGDGSLLADNAAGVNDGTGIFVSEGSLLIRSTTTTNYDGVYVHDALVTDHVSRNNQRNGVQAVCPALLTDSVIFSNDVDDLVIIGSTCTSEGTATP